MVWRVSSESSPSSLGALFANSEDGTDISRHLILTYSQMLRRLYLLSTGYFPALQYHIDYHRGWLR